MTKFGQVIEYNPATRQATIRFDRPDACKKCGACGGQSHTGTIVLKADCAVGNWVRVEMPEGRFLGATAITYVIPLVGLFLGIGLGWLLGRGNDLVVLAGAVAGIAVSVGILYMVDKRLSGRPDWTPHVAEVYDELPTQDEIGCNIG